LKIIALLLLLLFVKQEKKEPRAFPLRVSPGIESKREMWAMADKKHSKCRIQM